MNAIPPSLPSNVQPPFPVAKRKGSGFAASSMVIAVVGIPILLVFLINLFSNKVFRSDYSVSVGISGFGFLMCIFGLGFHLIGIALGITATVLGSKATGIIGIGLNVGILLLIIVATLFAVAA